MLSLSVRRQSSHCEAMGGVSVRYAANRNTEARCHISPAFVDALSPHSRRNLAVPILCLLHSIPTPSCLDSSRSPDLLSSPPMPWLASAGHPSCIGASFPLLEL